MLLDASAVLALLSDEPGADAVRNYEGEAFISIVTLAEVIAKLCERGLDVKAASAALAEAQLSVLDLTTEIAFRSGELRPQTRARGLSLGDRICLATAEINDLPVMTADRAWADLPLRIEMIMIR